MSLLHRALLVIDLVQMGQTAQICPVGSLKNNALETATALSNRACPTGTQIRASAGAGSQRSQSTNQHNRPKESTKLLRGNARWKVLFLPIKAPKWRKETHGVRIRCKWLSFPPPSHTCMGKGDGKAGSHWKHLTPSSTFNHDILELGPFSPQ